MQIAWRILLFKNRVHIYRCQSLIKALETVPTQEEHEKRKAAWVGQGSSLAEEAKPGGKLERWARGLGELQQKEVFGTGEPGLTHYASKCAYSSLHKEVAQMFTIKGGRWS